MASISHVVGVSVAARPQSRLADGRSSPSPPVLRFRFGYVRTNELMFSLQRLLGKEDKFFTMLEASAEEARTSVQALVKLSKSLDQPVVLDEFVHSRRKDKQITQDITEAVYTTFVTAIER